MMRFVADSELCDEAADRIENWVQRIAVAGDDHPGGERPGALLAECVEALVDDHPSIGLAGPRALDGVSDIGSDRVGDRSGKLALEAGGRAEMVEEVGMG